MIVPLASFPFPDAPNRELQLQPAGFDLTVAKIEQFHSVAVALTGLSGALDFDNSRRRLPATENLIWPDHDKPLLLKPYAYGGFGVYLVTYNETISVPADCAGMVLPRSSVLRCGAVLNSALWDPGYSGKGQGLLTVFHPLKLYRNARVGQFVLFRMETAADTLYSGQYQGEGLKPKDGIESVSPVEPTEEG